MTHSTKAIYKWLIQDSVRVGNTSSSAETRAQVYTENDHLTTFPKIEAIDYYTTHNVSSIRITPYPAGHVLGAAMFHIDIAGLSILFTGDYSREQDRHLIPATFPKNIKVDVMITESTYGTSSHVPRVEREAKLMNEITKILDRGGRVLMPVFALGRAQELLLILDEYWGRHSEYQNVPIYYASNLARKCMVVYQTYIGAMNDNIKRLFRERMAEAESAKTKGKQSTSGGGGPWDFKFIRSLKSLDRFDDVGGCVMLASPGMMQSGISRELLERWAPDSRNGVIITGYSIEGTMAKIIMNEPDEIQAIMTKSAGASAAVSKKTLFGKGADQEKIMVPRRCSVQENSFAAHVDGKENQEFIQEIDPPVVILVHGETHNMRRLKSKLMSLNIPKPADRKTKIFSPANAEEVRIPIRTDKFARVVGTLAERVQPPDEPDGESYESIVRNSVLVQNDLKYSLMDAEDLREHAGLQTTTITCKQSLTLPSASIDLIRWALNGAFGSFRDITPDHLKAPTTKDSNGDVDMDMVEKADEEIDRTETHLLVLDAVRIRHWGRGNLDVTWEGNMINDGLADAVIALLGDIECTPAAVRQSTEQHAHDHSHGHSSQPNGVDGDKRAASQTMRHFSKLEDGAVMPAYDRIFLLLEAQFGIENITPVMEMRPASAAEDGGAKGEEVPAPTLRIHCDKHVATLFLDDLRIECSFGGLRSRVQASLGRATETAASLAGTNGGVNRTLEFEQPKMIKAET